MTFEHLFHFIVVISPMKTVCLAVLDVLLRALLFMENYIKNNYVSYHPFATKYSSIINPWKCYLITLKLCRWLPRLIYGQILFI